MIEVHALWFPSVLNVNKRSFSASVLEFPDQLFANLIVVAEKAHARVAAPRDLEGHHIGEGTAGIQKTSCQDNERTIRAPIFQSHDDISICRVFGKHDHETQGGCIYKANEARGSMEHHVTDGSLARWADFPLRMPDRRVRHRAKHTDPVVTPVAPLNISVLGIVLTLDESEDGPFDRVPDVGSHKLVAVAPATEVRDRRRVILKPVTFQGVARAGLRDDVKAVHDSCVEEGFTKSSLPTEGIFIFLFVFLEIGVEYDVRTF